MSEYVKVKGLGKLRGHITRNQNQIRAQIASAIFKTAKKAVKPIRARVPRAFGELSESVQAYSKGAHSNGPVTVADAPHAGAVEIGSPPHTPNFERLLAWVKLRGMQGLSRSARTPAGKYRMRYGHGKGPTSIRQARRIATLFKALEVRGKRGGPGRHSPADAAVQVARAISRGIEKHGTKPHWYVRNSLPEIRAILAAEIKAGLAKAADSANPTMRVKDSEIEVVEDNNPTKVFN